MTDTTGIVERLLELSFVSEGVARSRDEMGWDSVSYHRKRAESMKEAADTIERQQKEIDAFKVVTQALVDDLVAYIKDADENNPNSGYSVYRGYAALDKARALLNGGSK
jgi:hypothetical protein